MEFLLDPGIWVSLLTLIILEIVLGIDNLVFIAILAEKLPPEQRDKARVIGLSLALLMRFGLVVYHHLVSHVDSTADYCLRLDILWARSDSFIWWLIPSL